jgi:hypothetical protein
VIEASGLGLEENVPNPDEPELELELVYEVLKFEEAVVFVYELPKFDKAAVFV